MKFILCPLLGFFGMGWAAHGAPSAPATSGLTVSGFIDVQHQWGRGVTDLSAVSRLDGEPTGFVVNQGAMVLSDEYEAVEMMIDIPFRSSPPAPQGTGDTSNDLELAKEEAQAYLKYQYNNGLFWQLGQFDSYFGIESNDTLDILFPQHGILHAFTPNTHTGLLVGYSFLPFYVHAMVANANAFTRQPSDHSAEFSLRFGWSQEPMQASVGVSYTNSNGSYLLDNPATQIDYDPRILLNAVVQTRIRKLELGVELDVAQSRLGEAQTMSGRTDHDLVYGYLGQVIYNLTDTLGIGVRYEYLKNDETNVFVQTANAAVTTTTRTGQGGYLSKLSLGTRYIINEELMAKAGFDMFNLNVGSEYPNEGRTQSWIQAAVGAVYDF